MTNKYVFEAVPMNVEVFVHEGVVNLSPCEADLAIEDTLFWAVYKRRGGTGYREWVRDFIGRIDAQKMAYEANRSTL